MIGKSGALIFMVYSIFNRRVNEIFQRTMTNGVESVLCSVAFYYFTRLTYKKDKSSGKNDHLIFDTNLGLMTLAISVAFMIRSSSLVGWIPLALAKIFSTKNTAQNLVALIQAGIFITVPTIIFSIAMDSMFYGKFTIPQINFVYINVVENLSVKFGVDPWFYYI